MANKPLRSIKFPGLPDTYEVAQADLSVNDATNPAYVHGRTHWIDDDGIVHPLERKFIPDILPSVTTDNNGAFLRVVNGAWAMDMISNAEGVSF